MGMRKSPAQMPDTFGLQEFFVTEVVTEVAGQHVRLACGARRGGTIHWLYTVVMPRDLMTGAIASIAVAMGDNIDLLQPVLQSIGPH